MSIEQKLLEWIKDFVEQPNPKLGNWAPCPYARAARQNNQIEIVKGLNALTDFETIDLDAKEVWVFYYPIEQYTGTQFEEIARELNDTLMKLDVVVLEDHPDLIDTVNGIRMNFDQASLLIIQKLSKLNEASNKLRSKGYYEHWSQNEIDSVVTWRYK